MDSDFFVEEARTAWIENEGIAGIEERLHRRIVEYLNGKNITEDHPVFELLRLDFEVCAMDWPITFVSSYNDYYKTFD